VRRHDAAYVLQASQTCVLRHFLDSMARILFGGGPNAEGAALHGQLMTPELTGCMADLVDGLLNWQLDVAREAAAQRLLATGQQVCFGWFEPHPAFSFCQ
jgi:hypothetical protein